MESEGRSTRYVQVLKSYCGTFVREIGPDTMTDQITREMIQEFLNDRKVCPRGKLNFARAIRVMSVFGKRQRCVPEDWAEIDHLTLPLVKEGTVLTYSPDDLKRLLAASPDTFIPCLALAAFAGMRSAEIERIGWDNMPALRQRHDAPCAEVFPASAMMAVAAAQFTPTSKPWMQGLSRLGAARGWWSRRVSLP